MKINWLLIAETYPKSYNRLIGETAATQRLIHSQATKKPHIYVSNDKYFHERDLYDFFDEQNVFVSIIPTSDGFSYMIFDNTGTIILDKTGNSNDNSAFVASDIEFEDGTEPVKKKGGKFKKQIMPVTDAAIHHETRRDAEGFAFEDAFSILEEK